MKGFYITITNNLLEPKHRKAMKESVWLFMWLIDKMTSITEDGIGKVLGGKPIKYGEVNKDLNIPERTYYRWIRQLKEHSYINTKRASQGIIISINKAKKRFGRRVAEIGISSPAKDAIAVLPKSVGSSAKKVGSIYRQHKDTTVRHNKENLKKYDDLKTDFLKGKEWLTPKERSQIQEEVSAEIRKAK